MCRSTRRTARKRSCSSPDRSRRCTTGHLIPVDGGLTEAFFVAMTRTADSLSSDDRAHRRGRSGRGELPRLAAALDERSAAHRAGASISECAGAAHDGPCVGDRRHLKRLDRACAVRRACAEGIASVAVDGWAVDYVRLDAEGAALADPFCYRDSHANDGCARAARAHLTLSACAR